MSAPTLQARARAAMLVLMMLGALPSCSEDDHLTDEDTLPYDISDPTATPVFVDGVTPIAASFLNACVLDFADQGDACALLPAPRSACISEARYGVGLGQLGQSVAVAPVAGYDSNSVVGLVSTGRSLVVEVSRTVTAVPTHTHARVERASMAVLETITATSATFRYAALATDGGLLLRPTDLGSEAVDPEALATPPVFVNTVGTIISAAANGEQLFTADQGATAFKATSRDGVALWSLAHPWTSGLGVINPAVGCDGARAYLVGDEDSTGAKLRVRAVVPETGATLWTYAPTHVAYGTTINRVASNGELVAIHNARRLVVLDARTGAEVWTTTYATGPGAERAGLSLAWGPDGRLYVGRSTYTGAASADNGLYCYDGTTGRLIWANGLVVPEALEQDGAGLFVAFVDGANIKVGRVEHGAGPMMMQRAEATDRYRRPWAKLLIPARVR